jgi:hypothetical protein
MTVTNDQKGEASTFHKVLPQPYNIRVQYNGLEIFISTADEAADLIRKLTTDQESSQPTQARDEDRCSVPMEYPAGGLVARVKERGRGGAAAAGLIPPLQNSPTNATPPQGVYFLLLCLRAKVICRDLAACTVQQNFRGAPRGRQSKNHLPHSDSWHF